MFLRTEAGPGVAWGSVCPAEERVIVGVAVKEIRVKARASSPSRA